jgi:hypothetical protein
MRKVVQQYQPGKFRPWNPSLPVVAYQDTAHIHYGDGREPETVNVREINREPYPVLRHLTSVENWSDEELAAHFLYVPRDYKPTDGMRPVAGAEPEYVIEADNGIRETYPEEPLPPPPPPLPEQTPLEKLAAVAGLSKQDIADALVEAGDVASRRPPATRAPDEIVVPKP